MMRDRHNSLTPTAFHILLALSAGVMHGYRIMQKIKEDTSGQFSIGPGILYTTIKRFLEEGLI
jgi:DNA-binding PadR family transcriptional regulator